jgi:RNA polymerase sigma factor (sigma-70 family)
MNKIYIEISKLTDTFRKIAHGITHDENKINEAVQELMLYFLQMNPETLKKIYDKDGILGVTKYGAVALRRALTSKRSNFYYKYEKYYNQIDSYRYCTDSTYNTNNKENSGGYYQSISEIPQPVEEEERWEKLEKIDKVLDGLYWYDRKLFKLYYYEGNTLDSLAKKTLISRNSIFTTIDKVRGILKNELNGQKDAEKEEKTSKNT